VLFVRFGSLVSLIHPARGKPKFLNPQLYNVAPRVCEPSALFFLSNMISTRSQESHWQPFQTSSLPPQLELFPPFHLSPIKLTSQVSNSMKRKRGLTQHECGTDIDRHIEYICTSQHLHGYHTAVHVPSQKANAIFWNCLITNLKSLQQLARLLKLA